MHRLSCTALPYSFTALLPPLPHPPGTSGPHAAHGCCSPAVGARGQGCTARGLLEFVSVIAACKKTTHAPPPAPHRTPLSFRLQPHPEFCSAPLGLLCQQCNLVALHKAAARVLAKDAAGRGRQAGAAREEAAGR